MSLRSLLVSLAMLAAACTTSTQDINNNGESDGSADSDNGVDTGAPVDTDPYVTDTGRPGLDFTSGRYMVTSIALAPSACEPCKADIDGDGDKENKISVLLDQADLLFPGGFSVADVNPRVAYLIEEELVIVLMSADNDASTSTLEIGVAQGTRDTDGALVPNAEEVEASGLPKQRLTGTFISSSPSSGELRYQTFGDGEIQVPFQFDDDEPVLNFTLKRARSTGSWLPERGNNPEKLDGFLLGAFSADEVLEGTIYPLIDAYELWDADQKQTYRDIARELIVAGADIDVGTEDPKISGVFSFTAEVASW